MTLTYMLCEPPMAEYGASDDATLELVVPASAGEIIDRLTILELKACRLPEPARTSAAAALERWLTLARPVTDNADVNELVDGLRSVNGRLWTAEVEIRSCISVGSDADVARVARVIVAHNERRAWLKAEIDRRCSSRAVDWKFYGEHGR